MQMTGQWKRPGPPYIRFADEELCAPPPTPTTPFGRLGMCESAFSHLTDRDAVTDTDASSSTTDNVSEADSEASAAEHALFAAASTLDLKAADDLLKGGADVLFTSAEYKYHSVLHELVLGYVHQMQMERHGAKNVRFIDVLTLFINNGLDVNVADGSNKTALHLLASYPGHGDLMKILLASGVRANLQDSSKQTALHVAAGKGMAKDVEALLDGGADMTLFNLSAHSALHIAAKRKYKPEIIRVLIRAGAKVNHRDESRHKRGSTPLHIATKYGCLDNVRALLAAGANVDLVDGSGQSVIHIAATHDLTGKVMECLHRHGASINDQDTVFRETPLHKAVKHDMVENFKFLVKYKANPNIKDNLGETPLHKACTHTKPYLWMSLMTLGGDIHVTNRQGLTPLDKALKAKNNIAVSIMKQFGYRVS